MKIKDINPILNTSNGMKFLSSGALVFYKPKKSDSWSSLNLSNNYQDQRLLEDAFSSVASEHWKGHYFSSGSEILVLDASGNVMLRNCEVSVKKDSNNFVHVYEPKTHFYRIVKAFPIKAYPGKVGFVACEDVQAMNRKISSLISKKLIDKPDDFSLKTGLKKLPIFQEPEQFGKD